MTPTNLSCRPKVCKMLETLCRVSESNVPNPSSMNKLPSFAPLDNLSDSAKARDKEVANVSPPDRVCTFLDSPPFQLSST